MMLALSGAFLLTTVSGISEARAGSLCGNGLIDRPQESCDPNASEYYGTKYDGCSAGQICKGCRCLRPTKVVRLGKRRFAARTTTLRAGAGAQNTCGNGRVDAREECDAPRAFGELSTQCYGRYDRYKKICTRDCRCTVPSCGDGFITKGIGEQCDPKAKPVGCAQNQVCTNLCRCMFMLNPAGPLGTTGR